jgi:hypothetical protein
VLITDNTKMLVDGSILKSNTASNLIWNETTLVTWCSVESEHCDIVDIMQIVAYVQIRMIQVQRVDAVRKYPQLRP